MLYMPLTCPTCIRYTLTIQLDYVVCSGPHGNCKIIDKYNNVDLCVFLL